MKALRFNVDEAQSAVDSWGFNCGPGALCAVLGYTPDELRPHLGDFEQRGYMNAPMVMETLDRLKVRYRTMRDGWPQFGLCRVQWEGPWLDPGVPMAARYRHTHWIAAENAVDGLRIFDVNAVCAGGWMPYEEWSGQLVPWLLSDHKRANRRWHLTHRIELALEGLL